MADLHRKSSEMQMLIIGADLPPELAEAISRAYEGLGAAAGGAVTGGPALQRHRRGRGGYILCRAVPFGTQRQPRTIFTGV